MPKKTKEPTVLTDPRLTGDPLLGGMDHLPEELQRFLRALVNGLRVEGRNPSRLQVVPVGESTLDDPYGSFRYEVRYADPAPDRFHNFMRRVEGTWR